MGAVRTTRERCLRARGKGSGVGSYDSNNCMIRLPAVFDPVLRCENPEWGEALKGIATTTSHRRHSPLGMGRSHLFPCHSRYGAADAGGMAHSTTGTGGD